MDFRLVWSDEFDYEGKPDPKIWDYEIGAHGFGNNEQQAYVDHVDNAYVKNGMLHIAGMKKECDGKNFTSAKLTTYGKRNFQYGKFEFRAKMPAGKGTWPAIWMLPDGFREGMKWPECGEIDILEHIGRMQGRVHFSLHTKKYNHIKRTQYTTINQIDDVCDKFYTYAMIWKKNSIEFLMDGESVAKFERGRDGMDASEAGWPFDQPFYLMINLALGGYWGGEIDEESLPAELLIDYIRYYELVE